jgi:hypothetical protein
VCDEVVVECASLGYGRAGLEEGFVEKYAQSFGDAERSSGVFHCMANAAEYQMMVGLDRHGKEGGRRSRSRDAHQRNFGAVLVSLSLMVGGASEKMTSRPRPSTIRFPEPTRPSLLSCSSHRLSLINTYHLALASRATCISCMGRIESRTSVQLAMLQPC